MAIYHVKGPDGIEHELEGPEGATDEQVIAKAKEAFGDATPDVAANRDKIEPGIMDETRPVEQRLLENVNHAAGGFGMGQLAGTVGKLGVDAATMGPAGIRNALSGWFKKKAEEQAIKAASPTTVNYEQMGGPDAARAAGRYMLDKKIVTPYADSEEMLKRVVPINKEAGKTIGEFRDKADLRSLAQGAERPTSLQIEQAVREKLQGKYGPGAEAGQGGELDNAIDEIRKLAPVEQSTTGEEVVQGIKNKFGRPGERPYYYEDVRAGDELGRLQPSMPEKVGMQTGPQSFSPGEPLPTLEEAARFPVEGTPSMVDRPLFSELADKATRLNAVAKNARQLNQPSGAMTDAANVLSHKSTEGLEGFLTGAEKPVFAGAKEEYGMTEDLKSIMDRTQNRDLVNNGKIPISNLAWYAELTNAVAPASTRATVADKIANALRVDPMALGKSGPVLQRALQAGKESFGATVYMLQHQDPEFKAKFDQLQNQ